MYFATSTFTLGDEYLGDFDLACDLGYSDRSSQPDGDRYSDTAAHADVHTHTAAR